MKSGRRWLENEMQERQVILSWALSLTQNNGTTEYLFLNQISHVIKLISMLSITASIFIGNQSGIFPCFRFSLTTYLFCKLSNAHINFDRVS